MEKLIDYGWFAILVKPLLWTLKEIQSVRQELGRRDPRHHVPHQGPPLPADAQAARLDEEDGGAAAEDGDDPREVRDEGQEDPQARMKMNEETMALYKQEGVNPAGGCLPLLLQMPILIAFYNLLAHSIELRHAPFMLWITDLSAKDPYYVTPILMTVTMWIQQQMTPATGDATHAEDR